MRRRRYVLGIAAAAVAVSAATWVVAGSGSTSAAMARWSWRAEPGRPIAPDRLLEVATRLGRVDPATTRSLITFAAADGTYRLVAAGAAPATNPSLALEAPLWNGSFEPLDERTRGGRDALAVFHVWGGRPDGATDSAVVAGVARADVARVEAALGDGTTRELDLNEWRAFELDARLPEPLPRRLIAYGARGDVLQAVELQPASPGPTR
jgi:hypothetical protein